MEWCPWYIAESVWAYFVPQFKTYQTLCQSYSVYSRPPKLHIYPSLSLRAFYLFNVTALPRITNYTGTSEVRVNSWTREPKVKYGWNCSSPNKRWELNTRVYISSVGLTSQCTSSLVISSYIHHESRSICSARVPCPVWHHNSTGKAGCAKIDCVHTDIYRRLFSFLVWLWCSQQRLWDIKLCRYWQIRSPQSSLYSRK